MRKKLKFQFYRDFYIFKLDYLCRVHSSTYKTIYIYSESYASVLVKNVTQRHQKASYQNLKGFKNGKISKIADFGKFQKPRT